MNDLERLDEIWNLLDEIESITDNIKEEKDSLEDMLDKFINSYRKADKEMMESKLKKWRKTFA
jgi:predicted  nucleic acid-binding Zn-ribbon protein